MIDWPHAPPHRFAGGGKYFITGSTRRKEHFYRDASARDILQNRLFEQAEQNACTLEAWSIFSNHYHLVVECNDGDRVRRMLTRFHVEAAIDINKRDGVKGRQVWFQYRDTMLTIEGSWLARLRYTHENAVHHGLVRVATQYPWCSASWFTRTAHPSFAKMVSNVKLDRVRIYDDFSAAPLP